MYIENRNTLKIFNNLFTKGGNNLAGVCGTYKSSESDDMNYLRDIRRFSIFRKPEHGKNVQIDKNNFIPFSSGIGAYRKNVLTKFSFPKNFNNSAGEDVFLQIVLQQNNYNFLFYPSIKGVHDACIDKSNLLKKMVNELKSTGNIISEGSKLYLEIPYFPFFLSYPLFILVSIPLFLIFNVYALLFLAPLIIIEIVPLYKVFILPNYSYRKRVYAAIYLLVLEFLQIFYLPFYLFFEKNLLKKINYISKVVWTMEIQKIKQNSRVIVELYRRIPQGMRVSKKYAIQK